ncbi:DUF5133 domain-containing protein [Streptomyces sp. NPDC058295]|uniref:DUF5133 domain-containing protein n=1 Tax=Streptomyces sp. NPDC058295 TaxID=3346431 RepID=UPI0036E5E105
MPLPATLRRLVKDYEALAADESVAAAHQSSARLRDLAYTLCVSTGTREISEALQFAHTCLDSTAVWPSSSEPQPLSRGRRSVVARDTAAAHRTAPADLEPSTKRTMASH